ncbi:MAG: CPBP family intramembrane metalloprotease [Candidatus Omnitrophica bacterium]|nr:CPBP family intramembrane metalloprotease [Candidatus Omnitrophota bacterium]
MKNNNYICSEVNCLYRFCVALVSIFMPFILLNRDIYGSFIFSFSIPFIWQIVYLGKSVSSLGLRRKSLGVSIVVGIISGYVLGLLAGRALQLFGLTSYPLVNTHNIQFGIGAFKIKFSLARELGYQLLVISNSLKGLLLYFLFSIVVIGLGEEIFWRGFVQRKIANRVKKSTAIWMTAILFALIHSYIFIIVPVNKGIILLMFLGIAGAIWGYLYEKIDNIWSVAISHGIAAAIIWKYYFFTPLSQ